VRRYVFASAVMLGAASEKVVYLLSEEIKNFAIGNELKEKISRGLKYRKMKLLLDSLPDAIDALIKNTDIPYNVHEGSNNCLFALLDAIRIQRNDAVHPIAGEVTKEKLRLLLLAFPHACKKAYDIFNWLKENET